MQQINNLTPTLTRFEKQIKSAIDRVIASGWLVLGPEVEQFEQSFADYLKVNHCVGVANGTDAIELSLRAMGVVKNDHVATVANAGMYTTTAILAIGAIPVFMDVDIESSAVTLVEVQRAVDLGVKAVVVTHLFGLAVPEIESIADYCASKHVLLLEDCAQAHGARVNGHYVGGFGDISSFSFYPTKNLGAMGDGGAVASNNPNLIERVRQLRQYGWTEKYKVSLGGARNSRLDEMQAAILSELLPFLDEANERRRNIAIRYNRLIQNPKISLPRIGGADYVAHLYVIRSGHRNELREHLFNSEIASDIHYPIPDHRQPIFGSRFADIHLQNTEYLAKEILTLPCYPEMSHEDVDSIAAALNAWEI